jgi:hypothetical protein
VIPAAAPPPRRKPRLGWLGPALLAVGVAAGLLGVYVMKTSRPEPGPVYDVIAIDAEFAILIRGEDDGGKRHFVQLVHRTRGIEWTAMVPHYAGGTGMPAVAWADNAISVRVERGGAEELWSFSTLDATKLGQLSLAPYALGKALVVADGRSEVITETDGARAFQVIDGTEGTRVVAFDVKRGAHLWTRDFARLPIKALRAHDDALKVTTSDGAIHWVDPLTGDPDRDVDPQLSMPVRLGGPNMAISGSASILWTIEGDALEVRDTQTGQIVARIAIR